MKNESEKRDRKSNWKIGTYLGKKKVTMVPFGAETLAGLNVNVSWKATSI